MKIKIDDIAYYLPEEVVTNRDLAKENPGWNMDHLEERVGVKNRHIARDNETAADLSLKACKKLFSKREGIKEEVDGIIFCTQSPDHIIPPNACILHKMLDLPEEVFAFDLNLACSGYIYGLALARGLIHSNTARKILLVTADTYSKYINKQDRSTRTLFGDGAAVSWITASDSAQGIMDIQCSTSGAHYDKFIIPAGGHRIPKSAETAISERDKSGNIRTKENIHMKGLGILTFVNSKVPKQVKEVLARNNMTIDGIDLFVFHQASKLALNSLARLLKINPEKMYSNLHDIGNTVSASVPIALKDAMDKKKASKGDKILLCGFGAGLSWGTAILEL